MYSRLMLTVIAIASVITALCVVHISYQQERNINDIVASLFLMAS